jgi:hypothetical protein
MSPRGRLPGQQGRQSGFANPTFAAERDFHDINLAEHATEFRKLFRLSPKLSGGHQPFVGAPCCAAANLFDRSAAWSR